MGVGQGDSDYPCVEWHHSKASSKRASMLLLAEGLSWKHVSDLRVNFTRPSGSVAGTHLLLPHFAFLPSFLLDILAGAKSCLLLLLGIYYIDSVLSVPLSDSIYKRVISLLTFISCFHTWPLTSLLLHRPSLKH